MLVTYQNSKISLFVLVLLVGSIATTTTYAGRLGDGPVTVELKNNNICFSVSKYKPRGYFLKSFTIDSQGLAVRNMGVSRFQRGVIWEQILPVEKNGSEFSLKPNQCVKYGALLSGYNSRGGIQNLDSGKFTVIISGYDPAANKMVTFMSPFSIDVINGKIVLK